MRRCCSALLILLFTTGTSVLPTRAAESDSQIQAAKVLLDEVIETNDRQKLDKAAAIITEQLQKPGFSKLSVVVQIQNIAQSYQIIEEPKIALSWWQKLIEVEPDNWRAWAKVVQSAQAIDDITLRDTARQKVFDLNKLGLVDQNMYCREQFSRDGKKIMAFEFFKPDTEFGIELVFHVSLRNDLGSQLRRYTLGETAADTQLAREMKQIGPTDHMYSVDGYDKRGQWLLTMTAKKPTYEEMRALVIKDLEKERPVTTRSETPAPAPVTSDKDVPKEPTVPAQSK